MPDWIEIMTRSLLAVFVLFIMTKILGKRQITQLSLFQYIVGITIGNLAAVISLETNSPWYLGVIALSVWVIVSIIIDMITIKSKTVRDLIDGKGRVLIQDGKVLEDNVKKERLTIDELMEQLRKKDVFRIANVEFAVMESSGEINVLLKKEHQPLTPYHLGIKVGPVHEPQTVIMDGNIINDSLISIGQDRQWLLTELEKTGVTLENVFIGQVDSYNQLYVDLYDDKLKVPEPQKKAALLALLKKCEADMELFSLSTKNNEFKSMFTQCSEQLNQLIQDLKPLLKR